MAIKNFSLPVTRGERIRVQYQRPDAPVSNARNDDDDTFAAIAEPGWKQVLNPEAPKPPRADRPLVVMMHGFPGGHRASCDDIFGEMESRLGELGYPTVRFDFRGCGESDGKEEDFSLDSAQADLQAVLQWGQHDVGHRSFILAGESLGAAVAVMGFDPKKIKAMILLWPALILNQSAFRELFTRERLLADQENDLPYVDFEGHKIGTHFVNEIYQADLTTYLEKITVPTLIQHGSADTDVPMDQAYFARDTIPGLVDIAIFEGGNHGLRAMNMRKHLFMNIDYFLARILKKLDLDAKS